jgi:hypothetical protein
MSGNPTQDRKGINAVEAIFLRDFGWLFREQSVSDYGIDAQVEVVEGNEPTGKLIALQIKTGLSYFRKRGDDFVFYGERRHPRYWTRHSLPVFLILHEPQQDLTLWQKIEPRLTEATGERWSIVVPRANVLNAAAKQYIAEGISSDKESIRRFNMAFDLDLIKLISSQDEAYFGIDDWVNKSLNMRGVEVSFQEQGKDPPDLKISLLMPARDHNHFMHSYFPWLDFEYLGTEETMSSEIEVHTLRVRLNDLGKSSPDRSLGRS